MIPIFELKRQYQHLQKEVQHAIHTVCENGQYTLGTHLQNFENDFADYLHIYHAVGVASGTDALTLALKALDIKPSDEVILPANSYPSAFGVALSGCKIRLVDCDSYGLMDLKDLPNKITKNTKVIIPVHLYGTPVDVVAIRTMIQKFKQKIFILEDAAQAHGAEIFDGGWRKAGTIGDIGIFSFYPSKNLGAYGDGGMIVTDKSDLDKKVKMLRIYGESSRYHSEMISGVSRLDELQAAILQAKLQYLDEWNQKRCIIADTYTQELAGIGDVEILTPGETEIKRTLKKLHQSPVKKSCFHLFVIRTKKRDNLMKFLQNHEVGCGIHYPVPIHLSPSFKQLGYKKGDFPKAEIQSQEILSLPIYPELTKNEVETVIKTVKQFFA